jgi:phospholipid/cholesterol/gamma-HCH transport system substrate-binding protein
MMNRPVRTRARAVAGPAVKLGVFALVTVLATYVLAATIANRGYGDTVTYRAVFTDATGLLTGDDVRIAGVRVGAVEAVEVIRRDGPDGRSLAEVRFSVRADRTLPDGVTAAIRYRNLVGQRYVALAQGPGAVGRRLPPGGTIPVGRTAPALDLTVVFGGFQPLFVALDPAEVNRLSYEIVQVLQGEAGTVTDLLAHTASLTTTIASRDAVIGRLVDNLNAVLEVVARRDAGLSTTIAELRRLVSGLAADRTAIGESLAGINDLARATADLLAKARPPLRADVEALRRVSSNLNDSRAVVDGVLERLPGKLATITRTATYGSWFNFYLCSFDGRVALPAGATYTPRFRVDQARCG